MQVHLSCFSFKTSGHSIALLAMCLLCTFSMETARGQTTYDEFSLSGIVVEELSKVLAAYQDAQKHRAGAKAEISDARNNYRRVATSGGDATNARNTLIRRPDTRD